jgi:hypothetical protein
MQDRGRHKDHAFALLYQSYMGDLAMRKMTKWTIGAATAAGLSLAVMAQAQAGVRIGIGVGAPLIPAPSSDWCYYHPGACAPAYVPTPVVGVFVPGHGYWDGHAWRWHRYWFHGGWRYRQNSLHAI